MSTPNDGGLTLPTDNEGNSFLGLWDGSRFWAPRADNQRNQKVALYGPDGNPLARGRDSVPGTGDMGMVGLAVRKDTPGSLATADGHYTALQVDGTGALRVNPEALDPGLDMLVTRRDVRHPLQDGYTVNDAVPFYFVLDGAHTDSVVLARSSGKQIKIVQMSLNGTVGAAIAFTLGSKASGATTNIMGGAWNLAAQGGTVFGPSEIGWFGLTNASEDLVITTAIASGSITGSLYGLISGKAVYL